MVLGKWTATCKTVRVEHSLSHHIQKKQNKKTPQNGLNVSPETITLLEENRGRALFDRNCSNIFLDQPLKAKEIRAKINKWGLIKLKAFA